MLPQQPVKRSFSLLEVLLTLALIAVALSACGFGLSRVLSKQRFEAAVQKVGAAMTLAQELMLDCGMDVSFILIQEEKGVVYAIETQRELPERLRKAVHLRNKVDGIEQIAFDGVFSGKIELLYDASLGTTPKGTLELNNRSFSKKIHLKGYPSRVLGDIDECEKDSQAVYPQEAVSFI